ncbi:MAG: hypothetical protein Q4C34_05090 [Bacteroidales bacterium]|nr:hypothetical protein [Bacteroidales bacterium]
MAALYIEGDGVSFTTANGGGEVVDPDPKATFTYVSNATANENNVVFNYTIFKTVDGETVPATEADGPFKVYYAWSGNDDQQAAKASTTPVGAFICEGLESGTTYDLYPKFWVNGVQIPGDVVHVTTTGTAPVKQPTLSYVDNSFKYTVNKDDQTITVEFNYNFVNPNNSDISRLGFYALCTDGKTTEKWENDAAPVVGSVEVGAADVNLGKATITVPLSNLSVASGNVTLWMKGTVFLTDGNKGLFTGNPSVGVNLDNVVGDETTFVYESTPTANDNNVVFNYTIFKIVNGEKVAATAEDGPFQVYYAWNSNDTQQEKLAVTTPSGAFICQDLKPGTEYDMWPKFHVKGKQLEPKSPVHVKTTGENQGGEDPDPSTDYVNQTSFDVRPAIIENNKVVWTYAIDPKDDPNIAQWGHTSGDWYYLLTNTPDTPNYFAPGFKVTIGNTIDGRVKGTVDLTDVKDKIPVGFDMWTRINGDDYTLHFTERDGRYVGDFISNYKFRQGRVVSFNFHMAYPQHSSWTVMFTYEIQNADNATPAKTFTDYIQYDPEDKTAHWELKEIKKTDADTHQDEPYGDWECIARPADDLDSKPWNPGHQFVVSNVVNKDENSSVPVTVTFELDNGTKLPADYEPKLVIYELDENENPVLVDGHRVILYGPEKFTRVPEVVNMFTLNTGDKTFANNKKLGIQLQHSYTSVRPSHGDSKTNLVAYTVNTTENVPTGIDDVTVDEAVEEAVVEYYNLQGVRVAADNLSTGIYIRRAGNKTSKIYVR